ncbi:MAG: AMP-binding protein [Acidimicrobiales bacterium]
MSATRSDAAGPRGRQDRRGQPTGRGTDSGLDAGSPETVDNATVASMIRHWAAVQPDAPMLTAGERVVSWSDVYRRSRRMAQGLRAAGVRAGDRVAFLDRNCIEFFEVFFGCSFIGAVTVAVNWRLSPDEMAAVIDDSTASVLFSGPDYAPALEAVASTLPAVAHQVVLTQLDAWLDDHAPDPDPSDPNHDTLGTDVVLQLYTSGTTGQPKGVMLTNDNVSCLMNNAFKAFDVTHETVSMVAMPLFHIGGSGWAIVGMSRGGHSVVIRDLDPVAVLHAIERHGVTDSFVVPALLMFMLATPELSSTDVSPLKTIFYGASPISEDVLTRSMQALRCDFTQLYGLTETCGAITALLPEDHDPEGPRAALLRSAGKPFDYVELRIVDPESGETAPDGSVGEVWTRSAQNMLGYWRKPDETAAVLTDEGWLHTGDAGWLDDEGYLFLHDRIKDMIVSGGENIYPAEVENVLFAHPGIADVAVIGIPDDKWGETVKAIVVPATVGVVADGSAPGRSADGSTAPDSWADDRALEAAIIAFARDRLAHYKCPTSVAFTDVLPRNPTGKVLKRELRAPYWSGRGRHIQ